MFKKYLFFLPTPPPFAGPEIIAKELLDSEFITTRQDIIYLNASINQSNGERGNIKIRSLWRFIKVYLHFIKSLLFVDTVFLYLSSSVSGFIRDSILISTATILGKKCIGQYHGSNFKKFYLLQGFFYQKYCKFILSKLSMLLVLGDSVKENFRNIYSGKIGVLPNGLSLDLFTPGITNNSEFTIFFMGHLTYPKGFLEVISAHKLLLNNGQNQIKLVFAGSLHGHKNHHFSLVNNPIYLKNEQTEIYNEINEFVENAPKYNAQYLGLIGVTEKIDTFRKSNLFVLPSHTEGLSMACLEAMAMGLPIIVTPVGVMPEVIRDGENGLITPVGDYFKLAENIEYLYKNRELCKKMGKNNIQHVRENFNIEIIAQKLFNILGKQD